MQSVKANTGLCRQSEGLWALTNADATVAYYSSAMPTAHLIVVMMMLHVSYFTDDLNKHQASAVVELTYWTRVLRFFSETCWFLTVWKYEDLNVQFWCA